MEPISKIVAGTVMGTLTVTGIGAGYAVKTEHRLTSLESAIQAQSEKLSLIYEDVRWLRQNSHDGCPGCTYQLVPPRAD